MGQKEIQQMHEAAEQRDWTVFQKALNPLVCEIEYQARLKLLLSYVQIFMNDFLTVNPQHKSAYDAFSVSEDDRTSLKYLGTVMEIIESQRGEPGVNNFRRGILNLQSLFPLHQCDWAFAEIFVDSTTNLLIAISYQNWGVQYPDLHNRWLHGTSNEDLLIVATHYARNPEQTQKTTLLLHQFATDIDLLIKK